MPIRDAAYYREYRAKLRAEGKDRKDERKKVYENAKKSGKQEKFNEAHNKRRQAYHEEHGIAYDTQYYRDRRDKIRRGQLEDLG